MISREIANQVAALPGELPDTVAHASTRALIDWVAAAVAGTDHPATVALRRATANIAGTGTASLIGTDVCADARTAVLINLDYSRDSDMRLPVSA
jgi:2-methylcitrate dehydratase PrpD